MTASSQTIATMPAALLYWHHAVNVSKAGDALAFRFERVLPLPVERLHVTASHLSDGSALIIGIEPDALRAHLATRGDITPATWEVLPDQLPVHLSEIPSARTALTKLNLLHGEFEPAPRRRWRQVTAWSIHLGLALIIIGVLIGVERRVEQARQVSAEQRLLNMRAIQEILPPTSGNMRPDTMLTMELRRLEQAAKDPQGHGIDVAQVLQSVWLAWPQQVRAQVQLLSANSERIVIRGQAPTLQDVETIARACQNVGSGSHIYRVEPLQAQQDARGASFLLTLVYDPTLKGQP